MTVPGSNCPHPDRQRFESFWQARLAQRRIRKQEGWRWQAYQCRCQGYHLGNPRKVAVPLREGQQSKGRYRNTSSRRRVA